MMNIELEETLKLIIDRYKGRTSGSVFIPMKDFPWYNNRNGQLTRLYEEGVITKPRYFDNGAEITLTEKGRQYFVGVLFPSNGSPMTCPVCGYRAKVLSTDALRSWAEISCENCSVYAIYKTALLDLSSSDLPLLAGYYRHVYHTPMTVQCDSEKTIKEHIEETRKKLTRDYQMLHLLRHYYQQMSYIGQYVEIGKSPAVAYVKDIDDLMKLVAEGEENGYLKRNVDFITITEAGVKFMNSNITTRKPTVFISYNWGSDNIAGEIEAKLSPYAEVKRDKKTVHPWGNLKVFMGSIRDQDFAVLIISDAYLKSEACMYEVIELMKEKQWDERVMYVVTDDACKIYDTAKQLEIIGCWENKENELNEQLKNHNPALVTAQAEELKKVHLISLNIGDFMAKVRYSNNPKMQDAIDAVVERVGGKKSVETEQIQVSDEFEDKTNIEGVDVPETLRNGWNFHNDIAIRLEMKARSVFGDKDRPYTKIYDADSIECGKFSEVLIDVLREKTGRESGREDIDEFIKVCSGFIGKSGYEIDSRIAQGLLNRFLELLA